MSRMKLTKIYLKLTMYNFLKLSKNFSNHEKDLVFAINHYKEMISKFNKHKKKKFNQTNNNSFLIS